MRRRDFLRRASALAGGLAFFSARGRQGGFQGAEAAAAGPVPPFQVSLAQWSLVKSLRGGKLDPLDFARYARKEFGIDCVEYVDQFYAGKAKDQALLAELKRRAEGEGVLSGLIMVDTAGNLGDGDAKKRQEAVEKHIEWLHAARFLGCHAMRVNARGDGTPEELRKRIVESGARLAEAGAKVGLNVVIENHGGPSSDGEWLAAVMKEVNSPWFGTLPDFGNFPPGYDRYRAVELLMPFAKAVSAKSGRFDAAGNEVETDYARMMKIVLDAGYRGWVGVESGAAAADGEPGAIRLTQALLEKARAAAPVLQPIFDGRDLSGWEKVAGGDWSIEDGVLTGKNGRDWSTDPSRTGSWLRTAKEYSDFELHLEYTINEGSNSGVFFRSLVERNPAFTGYEFQIHDSPGRPPSKGGPGSLYDYRVPAKNRIRAAGEWNTLRIIARGPSIRVHSNGEMVIDTQGDRSPKGFIGLQNHDERSVVRFRNIRLADLA